jgi:peptidoglycan/xylan/chitin deacetylase (PgdA/CDA1 family)
VGETIALSALRQVTRRVVRGVHARYFDRGLPDRIALVSHALPARHHRAFREMTAFFAQQGYEFTDPDGLQSRHHQKCVLVSFDDCFRDWYESLDLLESLSVKVTFYVNTLPLRDLADQETVSRFRRRTATPCFEPLSSDELVALRARGHTIGSHSHSHYDLASLPPDKARDEIRRGKLMLERIIGSRVEHFSYPYGMRRHFTRALRDTCLACGFKTVASGIPGQLHGPKSELLHRTLWDFEESLEYNVQNLRIDGRLFERVTGRSAV